MRAAEASPPLFVQLAAHPLRWRLLTHLAQSDRKVRELAGLAGRRQSLVSYHLGRLRKGRLVSMRRSSFDGRDAYYSLDLARCAELLGAVGPALHPALEPVWPSGPEARRPEPRRVSVLFLCTGNSARSQIAEALAAHMGGDAVDVCSAGSHPKGVHANALRVMRERGIDIAANRSKPLREFKGRRFDYVVTLCDRVRERCPEFPGRPIPVHWSLADPASQGATDEESYSAFVRTADELATRIGFLLEGIRAGHLGAGHRPLCDDGLRRLSAGESESIETA